MAGTYMGKVCLKHPELKGERRKSNWKCIECYREYHDAYMKTYPRGRTEEQKAKRRQTDESEKGTARKRERYATDPEYRADQLDRNKRRSRRMAVPPWADLSKIAAIYAEARRLGLTVDHEIPLHHPRVCGLHVETNLQLMSYEDNARKGNKWHTQ